MDSRVPNHPGYSTKIMEEKVRRFKFSVSGWQEDAHGKVTRSDAVPLAIDREDQDAVGRYDERGGLRHAVQARSAGLNGAPIAGSRRVHPVVVNIAVEKFQP